MDWQEIRFNLCAGEARQLAARLIAAADSHDGIDQSPYIRGQLEKIAAAAGVNLYR
jgi:hypothetical protein